MPKTGETLANRQARIRKKDDQNYAQYTASYARADNMKSEVAAKKKYNDRYRVLFGDK